MSKPAQSHLGDTEHEISISSAFWTQYISMVLKVLTVLVALIAATQVREKERARAPAPPAAVAGTLAAPLVLFNQRYENVFEAHPERVGSEPRAVLADAGPLDAIAALLLNHDVSAIVTVDAPERSLGGCSFDEALARAIVVGRALEKAGVPGRAYRIDLGRCVPAAGAGLSAIVRKTPEVSL